VEAVWAATQAQFPAANLTVSSLDAFADAIQPLSDAGALPVITSEIGDSWNYGAPADPYKLAVLRESLRQRNAAVAAGTLPADDPSLAVYERRLLMAGPEHNFGLSIGTYLPDARTETGNWSNARFHAVRDTPAYQFIESGWAEKRAFMAPAPVPGLQPSAAWVAFQQQLAAAVEALTPAVPGVSAAAGFQPVPQPEGQVFACGRLAGQVSAADGSLSSLVDVTTRWEWVDAGGGLARWVYQTFSLDAFNAFNEEYNPGCGPPCGDFS
jgi:hypothetical protein